MAKGNAVQKVRNLLPKDSHTMVFGKRVLHGEAAFQEPPMSRRVKKNPSKIETGNSPLFMSPSLV